MALLDLLLKSSDDGKVLTQQDIRNEIDTFMFEVPLDIIFEAIGTKTGAADPPYTRDTPRGRFYFQLHFTWYLLLSGILMLQSGYKILPTARRLF